MSSNKPTDKFQKALKKLNNKKLPHDYIEFKQLPTEEVMKRYRTLREDYMNYKFPIPLNGLEQLVDFLDKTISNPYITLKGQEKRLVLNGYRLCEDLKNKLADFKENKPIGGVYINLSLIESFINYVHEMPIGLADSYTYMMMVIDGGILEPILQERTNIISYQGLVTQEYKQLENLLSGGDVSGYSPEKIKKIREYSYYISKKVSEEKGEFYQNPEIEEIELSIEDKQQELTQVSQLIKFLEGELVKDDVDKELTAQKLKDQKVIEDSKTSELKDLEFKLEHKKKEIDTILKKVEKEFKQ